jgi:hypothetical protein
MNAGDDTSLRNSDITEQLVQFLVVSEENMLRNNKKRIIAIISPPHLTASWICLGMMRVFFWSREQFPASSRTSAVRYSRTDVRYTAAPAPILAAYFP